MIYDERKKETLATYSNSANLKARPRQRKRTETREAAWQKVSRRMWRASFFSFIHFDNSSNASAMAVRGCSITSPWSISGILFFLPSIDYGFSITDSFFDFNVFANLWNVKDSFDLNVFGNGWNVKELEVELATVESKARV